MNVPGEQPIHEGLMIKDGGSGEEKPEREKEGHKRILFWKSKGQRLPE